MDNRIIAKFLKVCYCVPDLAENALCLRGSIPVHSAMFHVEHTKMARHILV